MKVGVCFLLLLVLFLSITPFSFSQTSQDQRFVIVTAATAKVMAGDKVVAEIQKGTRLPFSSQNGDWYLVEIKQNGRSIQGWANAKDVAVDTAPALPSDKSASKQIKGWGTWIDPLGDCQTAERAGHVAIWAPGKYRDLMATPDWRNSDAPRIVSSVKGDFTVEVLVRRFPFPFPKTASNSEKPTSYMSAGLVVWQDQDNFLRLQRAANGDSGRVGVHGNAFSGSKYLGGNFLSANDTDIYLRVKRKSGRFESSYSLDGKSWQALERKGKELILTGEVKVGVFAINATNREITTEFFGFKITK
jgi:regulation of enolase protein 1 (concanavalin A-like superfamily)